MIKGGGGELTSRFWGTGESHFLGYGRFCVYIYMHAALLERTKCQHLMFSSYSAVHVQVILCLSKSFVHFCIVGE